MTDTEYVHYGHCHECQLKRGAKMPRHGMGAVTVSAGECLGCKSTDVGLVPDCDYDWPKKGKKAVFD